MPKFATQNLVELTLPSSTADDPALVTVDLNVNGGVMLDAIDSGTNTSVLSAGVLASVIKKWNFTDESGEVVPITPENVRRLSIGDVTFLSEKVFGEMDAAVNTPAVDTDEKKD